MAEQVMKKKAVPTGVEADIEEHSIVVHYEMHTIYGNQEGKQTRVEKKAGKKIIKMTEFQKDDINDIADELLSSCNLINPQRKDILLKALMSLATGQKVTSLAGSADIENLEEYIDSLYDDLQTKIDATAKILQLSQIKENLRNMALNDVLMSALARCLREDGQKSLELGTNIVHCFYVISHFQEYGKPLLAHKAPESLFKMIEQECKRYTTFYKKLADQRAEVQKQNSQKVKDLYQVEYDKFKKLVMTQDKLLFVALQTIINLTEIKQQMTGQVDLFYELDKLVSLLSQVVGRKPPNSQLVLTVLNYLKRLSVIDGGIEAIRVSGCIKTLMKLYESDQELYDPITRLLFNLSFNPQVRTELGDQGICQRLDDQFMEWNSQLLQKYQKEFDPNMTLQEKLAIVIKNHPNRKADPEIMEILKKASQASKFVYQLFDDEDLLQKFQQTNIGSNLTAFSCLCKDQDPDVIQTLQTIAADPKIAVKIVKNNLLGGLTDQFERTKDPVFMKLFTGLAGAIPQDQRAGKQGSSKDSSNQNQEALYQNAAKIADIAITTGDKTLAKQALQLISQAPAKHVKQEQAQQITQMALDALVTEEKDIEKKISAVGVVAMMMSRAQHVQLMCDNGDLKKLPDQLLELFQEAMGKSNMNSGFIGLDFKTVEFDLLIVILICILKASTYKVLRKEFLQRSNFFPSIIRVMYNHPRPGDDKNGVREEPKKELEQTMNENETPKTPGDMKKSKGRKSAGKSTMEDTSPTKEEKKPQKPLLIKSQMEQVQERVMHILDVLADLILDIMMFSEPDTQTQIRQLKFSRYNYDYIQKYLKK
ncbi:Kinesin-associated_protein [Hexamita inflata]|uniref:Kinesin-associated protein n=1 Tax=Hexamita inflata TaxID=28002 RepID=A0AA86UK46_9EUKA|nr:Kinesin-associated protein [Hexamita inflata]